MYTISYPWARLYPTKMVFTQPKTVGITAVNLHILLKAFEHLLLNIMNLIRH